MKQEKNKLKFKIPKLQHKLKDKILAIDLYHKRFNSDKLIVNKEIIVTK